MCLMAQKMLDDMYKNLEKISRGMYEEEEEMKYFLIE